MGEGSNILGLEDSIVSNKVLPLGSLINVLSCVTRYGWGWKKFTNEANTGTGAKLPNKTRFYLTYILPVLILVVFIFGYIEKFI